MKTGRSRYYFDAVVIGVSAGGLNALEKIVPKFPRDFACPVIVVQHRHYESDNFQIYSLDEISDVRVKEAEEKEVITPGVVYFAPSDYHLLIEKDGTFSLSYDDPVCYARPSIDVLFETAAEVYGSRVIGVILTGANSDGSNGIRKIKEFGGIAIVEDPETAKVSFMPREAIKATKVDHILPLEQIGSFIVEAVNLKEKLGI